MLGQFVSKVLRTGRVILVLVTLPLAAYSQKPSANCPAPQSSGWESEELKGQVKSIRTDEIHFSYVEVKRELKKKQIFDRKGNYLVTIEPHMEPAVYKHLKPKIDCKFDSSCRPLECKDGGGKGGFTKNTYRYDLQGRLIEDVTYDSENRMTSRTTSTYDPEGKLIEEIDTVQSHPEHYIPKRYDVYITTKSIYTYNKQGKLIERREYQPDGSLYAKYSGDYDAQGRLVRSTRSDHRDRLMEQTLYKFAANGLILEEENYDSSMYSKKDELLEGKINSGFGMFQTGYKIKYQYDRRGNWVKKIEYEIEQNNEKKSYKLDNITYRTIVYF